MQKEKWNCGTNEPRKLSGFLKLVDLKRKRKRERDRDAEREVEMWIERAEEADRD